MAHSAVSRDVDVFMVCQSWEHAKSYLRAWRCNEYLSTLDIALSELEPISLNRDLRLYALMLAVDVCVQIHDLDRAHSYIRQMYLLAAEGENRDDRVDIRLKALQHDMTLAQMQNDDALFLQCAQEARGLLDGFSNEKYKESGLAVPAWVRGHRHDLAHQLLRAGRVEMALPFMEANLACGEHQRS